MPTSPSTRGASTYLVTVLLLSFVHSYESKVYRDAVVGSSPVRMLNHVVSLQTMLIFGFWQWVFLSKFVFDTSGQGQLKYAIRIQLDQNQLAQQASACQKASFGGSDSSLTLSSCVNGTLNAAYLLFYNDVTGASDNWDSIYNDNSLSCEERSARAQKMMPIDAGFVNAYTLSIEPSSIPHYWYVALSACQFQSIAVAIDVEFYNQGWDRGSITSQFSFDDQGLFEMSIFFFTAYMVASLVLIYIVRSFMMNNVMHEIHWMLVASFVSYMASHMMNMIHYKQYSMDGVGIEWLGIFAECWQVVGYVIFVNVLLLIARGWTITTNKLSRKTENAVISSFIVFIYTALFFGEALQDPATTTYLYASWPGYLFIGMNLFLLVLFVYLLHRTYVFEKRVVKRNFYRRFGFVYALWFLQLPIFVLIAQGIPLYYQQKVLFGLQWTVQFLAFSIIPFLSRPKNAFEIYNAEQNFDQRIPSLARQMRVQPSAIELPAGQGGRSLPPVNRNMTSSLAEADEAARLAEVAAGRGKEGLDRTLHGALGGLRKSNGEGIMEAT